MLSDIPDKRLEAGFGETVAHPVKRRAKVIYQLLAGVFRSDLSCERCSVLDTWVAGFNPEQISVRGKVDRTLGCRGLAGAVMVVALPGPGNVPGPEHRRLGIFACKSSSLIDRHVSVFGYLLPVGVNG